VKRLTSFFLNLSISKILVAIKISFLEIYQNVMLKVKLYI